MTDDEILRGDPEAVRLLACSDRASWQQLVRLTKQTDACPPELARALLAVDEPQGWQPRLAAAFTGLNPDDGLEAHHAFVPWFTGALRRDLPKTHPVVLGLRLKDLLEDDPTARVRTLAHDIQYAGESKEHRALLGRAYLLFARRTGEDGDHERSIGIAEAAEKIFAELGDEPSRAYAVRMRAAGMLRRGEIEPALALLDGVLDLPVAWEHRAGFFRPTSTTEQALDEAARVAMWASRSSPEWTLAVEAIRLRIDSSASHLR
jgi:hypothetical protein